MILLVSVFIVICIWIYIKSSKIDKGYTVFNISKGKHYSVKENSLLPIPYKLAFAPKTLRFTAIFGAGCDYNSINNDSINKLYGISYGFDVHWRSVRIGWRYNSNLKVIELFAYGYAKGKRVIKFISSVAQYEEVEFIMFQNDDQVIIEANNKITIIIPDIDKSAVRFKLWPYFGGKQAAPQNMKIFIKNLK